MMTNFLKIVMVSSILFFSTLCGHLYAEKKGTSYADIDIMSSYVWRGQKLSDNLVLQPSLGFTYGGFGANFWANYDMSTDEHTETDVTLNYEYFLNKLFIDTGYIYYAVDGPGSSETQEIFISAGYEVLANPTMTVYYDFDEGDGAFFDLSTENSFRFFNENTLNLGISIGYNINNKIMGTGKNGDYFSNFYNGEITLSITIPFWKIIIFKPKIAYTFPLSEDAKEAIKASHDDEDSNILYGGLSVQASF